MPSRPRASASRAPGTGGLGTSLRLKYRKNGVWATAITLGALGGQTFAHLSPNHAFIVGTGGTLTAATAAVMADLITGVTGWRITMESGGGAQNGQAGITALEV